MAPSRDRTILGITSLAFFLLLSYLLFLVPYKISHSLPYYQGLITAIVLSLNIAVLFSWIGFGIIAGFILTLLVFLTALSGAIRSGCYDSAIFSASIIFTAFISYNHWKSSAGIKHSFSLNSEKLDEDINILSDDIRKKKNEIIRLDEKLHRYLVLKDVTEALTRTLSLEDIAKLMIERSSNILGRPGRILLFLVNMEKQELMLSASQGAADKIKAKKGDVFDRWVLKHAVPLIAQDVVNDFRFSSADTEEARKYFNSLIIVPLLSGSKVIGILRMDSLGKNAYTQDDLRLLDIIGGLGAVAIQNAFLYSWIQELAIRDSLTGLFVRRHFMKRFQEEVQRAARKKGELSVLMMDIDRFKWYNDKYGHATGDLVLRHITGLISSALREGDIAARYGGEEIAVLLLGSSMDKAVQRAEAIRKNIEENPLVVRRERHTVTISIGISSYPKDSILENELVKIADDRLYKAKSLGRNRVCAE